MCYQVIMAELCGMQIKVQVNLSKRYCCCFDQYRPSLSVLVIYTYGYCIKLISWHSLEEKLLLSPFCKCYNMVCMVVACVYEFLRQRRSLHGNPHDYLCPSSNKSIWGRVVFRYVCKCISYVNYQLRLYLPYRPVYVLLS